MPAHRTSQTRARGLLQEPLEYPRTTLCRTYRTEGCGMVGGASVGPSECSRSTLLRIYLRSSNKMHGFSNCWLHSTMGWLNLWSWLHTNRSSRPSSGSLYVVLPCVLYPLSHLVGAVALELDFGEVDYQRVINALRGDRSESHIVFVHVQANDRPRGPACLGRLVGVGREVR